MKLRQTATHWQRRIDRLSLRERVILFTCAALLQLAILDQAVLAPANQAEQQWHREATRNLQELDQLRQDLAQAEQAEPAGTSSASPARLTAQALAQARTEVARLEARLAAATPDAGVAAAPPAQALLARVLRRHPGVQLLSLSTRPEAASPPGLPHDGTLPASPWQAADLTLSGPYADLSAALADLAHDLPGLRWGNCAWSPTPAPRC